MKTNMKNIKKIAVIGAIAGTMALSGCASQSDLDASKQANIALQDQIAQLKNSMNTIEKQSKEDVQAVTSELNTLKKLSEEDKAIISDYADTLAEKEAELIEANEVIKEVTAVEDVIPSVFEGVQFKDVFINKTQTEKISDREVTKLFDGKVVFDGDDYDAEEIFNVNYKILANEEDFKGNPFLTFGEGDLEYIYKIENKLNTSLINSDETLKINFLGEDVEIKEWDTDKITLVKGKTFDFRLSEEKVIDGKTFKLLAIGDDIAQFDIDGEHIVVDENDETTHNGIKIYGEKVVSFNDDTGYVKIKVGDSIEEEIENGDEYAKDSVFEYVITANTIGIKNVEKFTDLDDDYKPLAKGDSIVLPNDHLKVSFDGLVGAEDLKNYDFDVKSKSGVDYLRVKGDFINGVEDYDEVYVNTTGIYDEDLELIDATVIDFANEELTMKIVGTDVVIDDIVIPLNVSDCVVDGKSIDDKEDDYMNDYGIIVNNPEDSIEDSKLKLVIPNEKAEAIVKVE